MTRKTISRSKKKIDRGTHLAGNPGLEKVSLARFTEQSYLNYSMYVILDRALPNFFLPSVNENSTVGSD